MSSPKDRRLPQIRPLPDPTSSQPSSPASTRSSRPLPQPQTQPQPQSQPQTQISSGMNTNTSGVPNTEKISPANFYGTTKDTFSRRDPPPLPSRPASSRGHGLGSKSTSYIPPQDDAASSPYRSPVLVADSPPPLEPPLIQPLAGKDSNRWTENWASEPNTTGYNHDQEWNIHDMDMDIDTVKDHTRSRTDWTNDWDTGTSQVSNLNLPFGITGRDAAEERSWWDASVQSLSGRPGQGALPVCVHDYIVHRAGDFFAVQPHLPDAEELAKGAKPVDPNTNTNTNVNTGDPPGYEELIGTLPSPQPNVYFSVQEVGWVMVLCWIAPEKLALVKGAMLDKDGDVDGPWPSSLRRTSARLCGRGGSNPAHHFHACSKSVDASRNNLGAEPFRREPWHAPPDHGMGPDPEAPEALEALVCCQCAQVVLISRLLPAVIPLDLMGKLMDERKGSPMVGQTPEDAVALAFATIHIVLQNRLWKNEIRGLPLEAGMTFVKRIGWSSTVEEIFKILGFRVEQIAGRSALSPPSTDRSTPEGASNRHKLLRAYIEVGAWLQQYRERHKSKLGAESVKHVVTVLAVNAETDFKLAIGADPVSIPRGPPDFVTRDGRPPAQELNQLGLTVPSATYETVAFAYLAQQRCDPKHLALHFSTLVRYYDAAMSAGEIVPDWFMQLIVEERDRGRFTEDEYLAACSAFGFGPGGSLGVDIGDADAAFLQLALKHGMEQAAGNGKSVREVADQFRILLYARGEKALVDDFERQAAQGWMTLDEAYRLLQAGRDVDEELLIVSATMFISDAPSQADKVREAVGLIAEARGSLRLKKYLEIGVDPGEVTAPVRATMPRGLNQLGNTCYLNSLLQYFYTIKDLREAVLELHNADTKSMDDADAKLTEDDLKRHRVGGRLVTKKEIMRSRKFVKLLAGLFWDMEYHDTPAITPEMELAKLALVTSKDEEEEDADRPPTDGSNGSADTDATLVDDVPLVTSPQRRDGSPLSPGSILGKRAREAGASVAVATDVDVDMAPPQPSVQPSAPPLMKRKSTRMPDSTSTMMFGRQHDVAECMDNCMFQIETALLRFGEMSGSEESKTSIVKRLFYGKLRQRISSADGSPVRSQSSIHEKEDPFSHLPLQVSEEGYDLYDGLSGYFDDTVEFKGKQARMEVSLIDLPPVLQIQLQRVQFNRDTLQAYKSNAYVKFDETIRMDRFLDRADPIKREQSKKIQAELVKSRERIQTLTQGKHTPAQSALSHVADFLTKYDGLQFAGIDVDLVTHLVDEQTAIDEELVSLRARVIVLKKDLEAVWASSTDAEYDLTSVFIHRGTSATFGHYFFYARHLPAFPDRWYKYNDSEVVEVPKEEVFADTTGQTANPYLLVYARKGSEIVDTVKRFDPEGLSEAEV